MYVNGIPYIATFIVLLNIVVDPSYAMLFSKPWLKDGKVTHHSGNNMMKI